MGEGCLERKNLQTKHFANEAAASKGGFKKKTPKNQPSPADVRLRFWDCLAFFIYLFIIHFPHPRRHRADTALSRDVCV